MHQSTELTAPYKGPIGTGSFTLRTILAVELFMDLAEVGVGDMGVDLRRVDGGVAEELLHGADVGAIREEISREDVAERVRGDDVRDARTRDIGLQVSLDVARRDAMQFV